MGGGGGRGGNGGGQGGAEPGGSSETLRIRLLVLSATRTYAPLTGSAATYCASQTAELLTRGFKVWEQVATHRWAIELGDGRAAFDKPNAAPGDCRDIASCG